MKIGKIALSVLCLLVGAAAGCGSTIGISSVTAAFLFAGASWLGNFGIQPLSISAAVAIKLKGFATVAAAALAVHGAHIAAHPGLVLVHAAIYNGFFWVLGIVGTLAGFIGGNPKQALLAPPLPVAAK